jgi:biotin carboxylase
VEIGHAVPAPIPDLLRKQVAGCVIEFLDAIGLIEGPAHTEVKLTSSGPRIVESHNRVGGDRINELVEIAYGVDLDKLTLGWPFRRVPEVEEQRPHAGAAIRFFTPGPGTVRSISGVEEARELQGIQEIDIAVSPGTHLNPLNSNWERAGYVIAKAPTVEEAIVLCEQALDTIQFEVEPAGACHG